jgi:glycosyltransferase involved in cell wall biosynthesis
MHQFSVITPTFNRAKYLHDIYDCLNQQGTVDFEWVLVDDGSSDGTEQIISQFAPLRFELKYIYQENAGKPTAINVGVSMADSYISVLLDSDDILLPHTLETVWQYFDGATEQFKHTCACVSGLCIYDTGQIIGGKFPKDYYVSDHIRYCWNNYIYGDKCEFTLTTILKKYPFPVISGEKFITESTVWNRIAINHQTLYVNQLFCKKKYLQKGLSSQQLFPNNPRGSELFYNEATVPQFCLRLQIKHSVEYIHYAKINKQKHIFIQAKNKNIFLFGLYIYYMNICKQSLKRNPFLCVLHTALKPKNLTNTDLKIFSE